MKTILTLLALPALAAAGWAGYGSYLSGTVPQVQILEASPLAVGQEKTLPFYELMSPVPNLEQHRLLPKLEYKKGPPDRFIERITVLVQPEQGGRERIVYHGRRTRTDLLGLWLFPAPQAEARYLETAFRVSQGQASHLSAWREFLLRPLLLREAASWLKNAKSLHLMEQAGAPAFLVEGQDSSGRARATALFVRRNSFYRVDYSADREFLALHPLDHFRKSFLTEKRADAMEYLAKNLSEVRLEQSEASRYQNTAWPILLLAANVSVDPSSIDAFFHFAGISALLYRSVASDSSDSETLDVLRNNVLASEFYAKDVSPEARKTAEIGRLARLLTRSFQ